MDTMRHFFAISIQCGSIYEIGAFTMSVRATVTSQFEKVALEQHRKLAKLSNELRLLESGLDSLSFAVIVMRLEETLGFDPFDVDDDVQFPVTFGDFVRLYENHSK
jgi:acyl carrier protein